MIFAAIAAGGSGTRMSASEMPKQFMMLGNRPIIIHTVEKFMLCSKFERIYIGMHRDWIVHTERLLEKYGILNNITVVEGGNDRNSTIFNIIKSIETAYKENDAHVIVTHDCVRPFVTLRIINENIDSAIKYGACDTVVPAVDTIVISEDGKTVTNIPERRKMYLGQTPQSFNMSILKSLYCDLNDDEKNSLTDACKIFYLRGKPVYLAEGDTSNIKITTVSDYNMAQAMVTLGGNKVD